MKVKRRRVFFCAYEPTVYDVSGKMARRALRRLLATRSRVKASGSPFGSLTESGRLDMTASSLAPFFAAGFS